MRIAVCVRQGLDGELNPFDASAYEIALSEAGAEVILVSMGVPKTADLLLHLTRLGASRAILLSDPIFSGSDTLATAYVLSRAMEKLKPDRILCGRKTLIGDTGQVPPMLAEMAGYEFLPDVLTVADGNAVTREGNRRLAPCLRRKSRRFCDCRPCCPAWERWKHGTPPTSGLTPCGAG